MSTRRSSSVLIGRDEELGALEAAVADRARRPITLVAGEAGVGKTRLVAEFLAGQAGAGLATTVGACIELGADLLPYAPFVDAVGRHVEALGATGPADLGPTIPSDLAAALGDLATLVPELLDAEAPGPATSRGRMYEAVRILFDRTPEPLVCAIEDLHWADRSSLALLTYLARRLRHGRTAIVATVRTDELHRRHPLVPVLAELERSGRTTRIDLPRLNGEQVGALVRAIRPDASDPLIRAVTQRSEGVPFLAEELLAVDAGAGDPLPITLRDLLLARLAALTERARRSIAIVAVVERPADFTLIEGASDAGPREIEEGLREAVDRGILVVEPRTGQVTFRHALLREAVIDDLLPSERVRIHASLARILAERPELGRPTRAGAAGEVAHHLYHARDLAAAFRATAIAADAAVAARAYPEARDLYDRALELLERLPDGRADRPGLVELLDAAAEASFHAGDIRRAMTLGAQAVEASEGGADDARTGYLLGRLVEWIELSGDFERIVELAERAVALVPATPPSRARAYALIGLAAALGHADRAGACLDAARAAVEVAVACGSTPQEAVARCNAAGALTKLGRDREAVDEVERAVVLAGRSRGTEETAVVQTDRAVIHATAARFAGLGALLCEVRAALDREGSLEVHEPWIQAPEMELLIWEGRWTDAEAIGTSIIEARERAAPLATHLVMRGRLRARSGRLEAAIGDLRAALDTRPPAESELRADALACLAEIALLQRDPRGSIAFVNEGLDLLEATDELPVRVHLLAVGLEAAGDLTAWAQARRDGTAASAAEAVARRYVDGLQAAEEGRLVEGGGREARILSRVVWGTAAENRQRGLSDPDAWARAATMLVEAGEPYLSARCRLREAEDALACGERARAGSTLRGLFRYANQVGAIPLAQAAANLARRGRVDVAADDASATPDRPSASTAPGDPYGLSTREREVLALLIEGHTNRQIGAELFITEKTASVHVTHILDKMGVTSRGAAAALAVRGGIDGSRPAL